MFPFLHPQSVHFPIAFLVLAGVLYVVSIFSDDPWFRRGGMVLHIAGLCGLVLAILTGMQAESEVVHTERIHSLSRTHELLGYAALWLFGMMLVWRYLRDARSPRGEQMLFALIFWMLIGLMGYSAHLGGRMVYEEGAGVAPMEELLREQLDREQNR